MNQSRDLVLSWLILLGRLDSRNSADELRSGIGVTQVAERKRRGRVARYDGDGWPVFFQQFTEELDDALVQRRLLPVAIGKRCVIGDIDKSMLRHQHARLAQDGQAADAAVKEKNWSVSLQGRISGPFGA